MSTKMDDQSILDELQKRSGVLEAKLTSPRRITILVAPLDYHAIVADLAKKGFEHVLALTSVDAGDGIDILLHLGRSTLITVKVKLPLQNPEIASVVDVLPGISIHEREVHDLMGVNFLNNPDLSRFMLSEDWPEGVFPLRKCFVPKVPEPIRRP
ncbi:MAG: NADH-quinone oxidoreductase subunit C [Candidatus Methanomethylicus sp.]|nr:NADH-quinone oxidoreductase subunit C [Candidatus Methanomethylicus sp.]